MEVRPAPPVPHMGGQRHQMGAQPDGQQGPAGPGQGGHAGQEAG